MGTRGPRPTPSPILKLRGTHRDDRTRGEPEAPDDMPVALDLLSDDERAVFDATVAKVHALGIASSADDATINRYAWYTVQWWKCAEFIRRHGTVYTTKNDDGSIKYVGQLPQVSQVNKFGEQLLKIEREFGLTPSARTRINANQDKEDEDDLSRLLRINA